MCIEYVPSEMHAWGVLSAQVKMLKAVREEECKERMPQQGVSSVSYMASADLGNLFVFS